METAGAVLGLALGGRYGCWGTRFLNFDLKNRLFKNSFFERFGL